MNPIVKANVYEIQTILYWILGVLILHLGTWHWLGWVSIGYGWLTMLYTIRYIAKNKEAFNANH